MLVAGRDAERDFGVARMVCREDTAIVEGNAVTFSGSRLLVLRKTVTSESGLLLYNQMTVGSPDQS